MPRKQRFKPTRKPKQTTDGASERQEQQPSRVNADDSSPRDEEPINDRRGE